MPIVTDGLIGYWHYQQGVSGSTWENIAPSTKGKYNGSITGAVKQVDGMYFDGIDDHISIPALNSNTSNIYEVELYVKPTIPQNDIYAFFMSGGNALTGATMGFGIYGDGRNVILTADGEPNPAYSVKNNELVKFNYVSTISTRSEKLLVNDSVKYPTTISPFPMFDISKDFFAIGALDYGEYGKLGFLKGRIASVKIYSRELTTAERSQNTANGTAIGLAADPPPSAPAVTIISNSQTKISDEATKDRTTLKFKFDQNVTEWRVRVVGVDKDTGTLADSGGSVNANTEISAVIDYTELYQEGQNRVNIYGKNAAGQWTPYET